MDITNLAGFHGCDENGHKAHVMPTRSEGTAKMDAMDFGQVAALFGLLAQKEKRSASRGANPRLLSRKLFSQG
jgi:hypothetical protein